MESLSLSDRPPKNHPRVCRGVPVQPQNSPALHILSTSGDLRGEAGLILLSTVERLTACRQGSYAPRWGFPAPASRQAISRGRNRARDFEAPLMPVAGCVIWSYPCTMALQSAVMADSVGILLTRLC